MLSIVPFSKLPIGQHFLVSATAMEWVKVDRNYGERVYVRGEGSFFTSGFSVYAVNRFTSISVKDRVEDRPTWQEILNRFVYPDDVLEPMDAWLRTVAKRINDSLVPVDDMEESNGRP